VVFSFKDSFARADAGRFRFPPSAHVRPIVILGRRTLAAPGPGHGQDQ